MNIVTYHICTSKPLVRAHSTVGSAVYLVRPIAQAGASPDAVNPASIASKLVNSFRQYYITLLLNNDVLCERGVYSGIKFVFSYRTLVLVPVASARRLGRSSPRTPPGSPQSVPTSRGGSGYPS